MAQLKGAAEMPREVQQLVLEHIIATAAVAEAARDSAASFDDSASTLAELDSLRGVCKLWHSIISSSPAVLDLLWTEKCCSLRAAVAVGIADEEEESEWTLPGWQP
jgi:hypothetical protein